MLTTSSIFRGSSRILRKDACNACLYRTSPPLRQINVAARSVNPSLATRNTKVETRADVEKRERHKFYRMLQADKLLPCRLDDANKIIQQFLVNKERNMDPATNARKVAERKKSFNTNCHIWKLSMAQGIS